jgi:hypothetical protein
MPFAQGPVRKPGGTGFMWWNEQMTRAGDVGREWLPRQSVVGVFGLGQVEKPLPKWLAPLVIVGVLWLASQGR